MKTILLFCLLYLGITTQAYCNVFHSQQIKLGEHTSHLITWSDPANAAKPPLILLSGPIDTWHSDSAWWATVGKKLSKHYRVFALDRAGIATEDPQAPVGYLQLADDMRQLISHYSLQTPTVVAFASSNISIMRYLKVHRQKAPLNAVVMIDPDVLTPFSIGRYKQDAEPFKQNLDQYLAYIGEGKYVQRVEQKNQQDKAQLEKLIGEQDIEWPLVEKMFAHRLTITSQQNQFREIAVYGEELDAVAEIAWTAQLPLLVIDTQFEQAYIDASEDEEAIKGLRAWKQDGKDYYQALVKQSKQGEYVEVNSQAHLYQVEKPTVFITKLREFLERL